jgi:hypothetical protein
MVEESALVGVALLSVDGTAYAVSETETIRVLV